MLVENASAASSDGAAAEPGQGCALGRRAGGAGRVAALAAAEGVRERAAEPVPGRERQGELRAVAAAGAVLDQGARERRRGERAAHHEPIEGAEEAGELDLEGAMRGDGQAGRGVDGAGRLERRVAEDGAEVRGLGRLVIEAGGGDELEPRVAKVAADHRVTIEASLLGVAARYLVDELGRDRPRFVISSSATTLQSSLQQELDRANIRRDFEEDLRTLEKHPAERLGLARAWLTALANKYDDLKPHVHALLEAAVVIATERKVEREPSSAAVEVSVTGLLGQHARIENQAMQLRLDDFVARRKSAVADAWY